MPRIEYPTAVLGALLLLFVAPLARSQSSPSPASGASSPQSADDAGKKWKAGDAAPASAKSPNPPATPAAPNSNAADYSKEPYVIESAVTKVTFENDGTYTFEVTQRTLLQSQAALQQLGVLQFPFASAISSMEVLYVRVLKPDGRTVQTPPENALDMPAEITRQAPFYSDLHEEQIAVKGLEIGDRLETQYRVTVAKPLVPGQFWTSYDFVKTVITRDQELQISVPQQRVVTIKSTTVQPAITEGDGRRVYLWKTSNLIIPKTKPGAASEDASGANVPAVQVTTF